MVMPRPKPVYAYTIAGTSNRLTHTSGPPPAKTNTYDAAGNLTGNGTATFAYSDRGRMDSATVGANTVTYLYNGQGQRVKKPGPTAVVPTGAIYYAYDEAGHLIGLYDTNLQVLQELVYLGDTPVALIKQTTSGSTVTTAAYYVYADQIDTPRVITRASDNKMMLAVGRGGSVRVGGDRQESGVARGVRQRAAVPRAVVRQGDEPALQLVPGL